MMLSEVLDNHVVRSSSLASDRIHHALLFIGPRGVGKRTTAEVLHTAYSVQHHTGLTPVVSAALVHDFQQVIMPTSS